MAARISPLQLQMTTPMQEFLSSSDAAASVLTLKKPTGELSRWTQEGPEQKTERSRQPCIQQELYRPYPRLGEEESQNPHGLLDCGSTRLTKQQQRKVPDHLESLLQ